MNLTTIWTNYKTYIIGGVVGVVVTVLFFKFVKRK